MYDTGTVARLRRPRRVVLVVAAVVVSAAATVVVSLPRAHAAVPLFEQIDTLDRFPADAREVLSPELVPTFEQANARSDATKNTGGTAIMLPEVRQLWQLYTSPSPRTTAAVVRDLDTMRIVKTVRFSDQVRRATLSAGNGGDWAYAVDTVNHRLFFLTTTDRAVLEVDLRTFTVVKRFLPGESVQGLILLAIGGMTYDRYTNSLLVLYSGLATSIVANTNTLVYTLDVSKPPPAGGTATVAGSLRQVRSCSAPVTSTDSGGDTLNWDILVSKDYLYVPCQRAGHTGIVVRTTRTTASDPPATEDVVAGPVYAENALADQGAQRMVMTTAKGKEIWTFEAETMSFAGVVATGPSGTEGKTGYGLDPATGRVFFQSPTFGLGVVEARFFPLPQARIVDHKAKGRERILSDTRTNRVFVLEGFDGDKPRAYRIYRVLPAPVPPAVADPDRNTADVDERPGTTETRFNASASGYGARVVWAKGFAAVPPAPTAGVLAPTSVFLLENSPACGFTDREFVAGRVFRSEYDTGSTAAEAIALDVDGNTKQDLDKPSHCDVRMAPLDAAQADDPDTKDTQETYWQWKRADCSSSQGETDTSRRTAQGAAAHFGPSAVNCPEPGGILTATAEAGGPDRAALSGADSPVSVGRAYAFTRIEKPAGGGVRSTVTSVAQDVRLVLPNGLAVTFAEIRSTAESFSNGRPRRPDMSTYEVSIRGARIGDQSLCGDPCKSPNLTGLVDILNTAASGRALFRTGASENSGLDRALVSGSKKGAQTAVQKSPVRRASDRALTGDFTVEVPGLEVVVFNDNTIWGRARQLYQFAAVASSATYNVVARPTDVPFADLGPFEGPLGEVTAEDTPVEAMFETFEEGDGGTSVDTAVVTASSERDDDDEPGGFWAPLRAVARGLRLFFTDPRHSLLLLTAWALLGLPGALSRRRRLLTAARSS